MSSKLGSARGAAVKKFTLDKNVNDGLVLLALEDVKVDTITLGDNTKEISFNGKELPRLSFIFRQANAQPGVRPAYYYHSFRPVEHTEDNVLNKHLRCIYSGPQQRTGVQSSKNPKLIGFELYKD